MAETLKLPGKGQGPSVPPLSFVDDLALRRWVVEQVNANLCGKFVEDSVFTARCDALLQWVKK